MKKAYSIIIALSILSVGNVYAFDWFGGRLSLGGGYGYSKPKLPYSFQDTYQAGPMWTGHVKYFLNNDVSLVASYSDLRAKNRTSANDIHFRPLIGSVRYNLFHHLPFTPYLTAGAGVGFNRMENADGSQTTWTKLAMQGGVGLEFFINENTSIDAEALYHDFVGPGNSEPYRLASAVGMLNLYFGPGPETRRMREEAAQEKARADAEQQQALAAQQQTLAAQQQTLAAQQQSQTAQAQANAAQQQVAVASAAAVSADQKAQAMQAEAQQAQAEMDKIKDMVARKDISPITFQTGSATLLASSSATLDKVAVTAKKYPDLQLRVEGHTDNVGGDDYNQQLSQKRADAVRDYLVNTAGVSANQVVAVGFGKTRPIASNETSEGRAQNRRVEFIFFIQ